MSLPEIDILTILIFSAVFLVVFAFAEVAYHYFKVDVGYTRKFVHIMTGVIVMFFPIYFKKPVDLISICVLFFILLAISKRLSLLKSVNAIKRSSSGSTLYPVVVIICYLIQYYQGAYVYFFVPILILAFADPAAEYFGKKFEYRPYYVFKHKKTISGSLGFFAVALATCLLGFYFIGKIGGLVLLMSSLCVALACTLGEAVGIKGFDNLVVPVCAALVMYIFQI